MEKKSVFNIRYTMKPEDIMTFVSGLHEVQADMIECAVIKKEKEGFPEANTVIQHIRNLPDPVDGSKLGPRE
jgi:predicted Rdx family selenoprotein